MNGMDEGMEWKEGMKKLNNGNINCFREEESKLAVTLCHKRDIIIFDLSVEDSLRMT